MNKKLAVLGLGIGAALSVAAFGIDVAPAAAQSAMAAYRLTADDTPGDKSLIAPEGAPDESSGKPPHHEPPIRFTTVDYQDAGDAGGTVKLAGTAPAGTVLYIFFDENPFAKLAVDDQGKWSVERDVKLETGNHTIRADQYDETTRMLSGRAMVTMARVPPGEAPKDQAAGPGGAPAPQPSQP
jgi:hypothetical protein